MSENIVGDLVSHQVDLIKGIIRETRVLIGSFESVEALVEDKVASFEPLLKLVKDSFQRLVESNLLGSALIAPIQTELGLLEEQVEEFARYGIFSSLSGNSCQLPAVKARS